MSALHVCPPYLRLDGVSVSFGQRRVLTDIWLSVPAGERVGLIELDAGEANAARVRGHLPRIGLLHQEPPFAAHTLVADALEDAVAPVRAAADAVARAATGLAECPDRHAAAQTYDDALAEAERVDAWSVDSHIIGHSWAAPRTEARSAKKFYADRNSAAVSRRVNDARSRLESLRAEQIRKPPRQLKFAGLAVGGGPASSSVCEPGPALLATQVSVAGRLAPATLAVGPRDRWLLDGPNGCGKSTLLSVLAEQLQPTSGSVFRAPEVSVGLLTQEVDLPDPHDRGPSRTVLQTYSDLVGNERAEAVPLAAFGLIAGRDEHHPLAALSTGQQRRLALAVVLANPPDVLLLDEPTNHLSLLLVTELERAIPDYPGAVVVASHDRWLRRSWSGQLLHLTEAGFVD